MVDVWVSAAYLLQEICRRGGTDRRTRSRDRPIPHALVPLPSDKIQEDLRYDVQVEMELVRPPRGQEETGQQSFPVAEEHSWLMLTLHRQLHAIS